MENSYIVKELSGTDPAFDQYKSLVLATWLRALKHGNEFFREADAKTYWAVYSKVILALLRRPTCVVRLAVMSDDHDCTVGWSVTEGTVLHFVFVKHQGRKQGIARSLVPKNITVITHITKTGKSLWKKKLEKAIFNPF